MTLWDVLAPAAAPAVSGPVRVHRLSDKSPVPGRKRGDAKLDPEKVRAIRVRLHGGESAASIAPDFGVQKRAINKIRAGETWGEVL